MAKSLYTQDELDVRQRAYHAAGRSCMGQSIRYFMWLLETAKHDREKEFLKRTLMNICEIYFQPH